MNKLENRAYYGRLKQRRDEIIMTRKYLQKEQRAVEENKEWIDRAAYQSRVDLLDNLRDWYIEETAQIDAALTRIADGKYGVCLACHVRIEKQRLELMPAAAFCASCQDMREQLSNT